MSTNDPRKPVRGIREVAERYMRNRHGPHLPGDRRPYLPRHSYAPLPVDHAREVADYFDAAPVDAPATPALAASYRMLCGELLAQWHAIERAGIRMVPWLSEGQPYANSEELFLDLAENRRMYFFPTVSGFGEGASQVAPEHPLLSHAILHGGRSLCWNDVLRAVHDVFGHAADGNQFGPRGEYNAWLAHARMFSPGCWLALACETKAQNFWVNFGPHLRRPDGTIPGSGEDGYVPPAERPYAAQKLVELPFEWCRPA